MRLVQRFSRAMAWPSGRLRLALAGFLLLSGLSCEIKSYLFFTPPPRDIATIPDIDPPAYSGFVPVYGIVGPLRISQFSYILLDGLSTNGGPRSGLDVATVQAVFLPSLAPLPLTSSGDRYTASLAGVADGAYNVRLTAKDKAGNLGTSLWSFTLKNTSPLINVTPPTPGPQNVPSVQIALTGTVTDVNIGLVTVLVLKEGPSGVCGNTDNGPFPEGAGPGFVSKSSFDVRTQVLATGGFAISVTIYNLVQPGGAPAIGVYCFQVRGEDTAKGSDGLLSPNVTVRNVELRQPWTSIPPSTGSVIGRVTSGGGVSGATMTAGGRTATTGADGSYRIDGLALGAQTIAISNLPAGVTCTPSSKSVTVVVLTDVNVDFICVGFILTYTPGTWVHDQPGVSSLVCLFFVTAPIQANAGWSAVLMGPAGGVQGTGQYNGTLSSAGSTTLKGRIVLFGGPYFWVITVVGAAPFTSPPTTVPATPGTCS